MKKLFALLLVLVAVSTAHAEIKMLDGGFFTIRVPVLRNMRKGRDWKITPRTETSASVIAPDKSFVISVSRFDATGKTLHELAARLARTHGARELTKMAGEGEAYEYVGAASGLPLYAQVFDLGQGQAGYAAIIGDHESGLAAGALNSIRFAPIEETSGDKAPAPQTPAEPEKPEEKSSEERNAEDKSAEETAPEEKPKDTAIGEVETTAK